MDYVITFSDVMAGVITLGLGVITFFIKGWFNNLKSSTEEIKKQIKENDDKVNKRIDKLEEETDRDIANIKQELNDIKGDFATTFVLREDFFRSMNGVEDRMRSIDSKIDKLLTTTKETYTSERWGKEGGTTIHQISFTVDISKIKDLPLLYKLIDELKDAQNRTDSPTPATT